MQESVNILDQFVDQDSENYQALKSMISLWNPESSKWAVRASKKYKMALGLRSPRPKGKFF